MRIYLNEQPLEVSPECSLAELIETHKSGADIVIINGYPADSAAALREDDRICLIRRGEQPDPAELEALLVARHTPAIHQRLKRAAVGIAGAGGLGSQVAVALARTGIGSLYIADFDLVEPSNLNRQHYFIDQIGMPKVTALQATLKRINPATALHMFQQRVTRDNLDELFEPVDILIEAFDRADQKAMLANRFLELYPDKYLIAASGVAGYASANRIRSRQINRQFYLCGDETSAAAPGRGLMAPRVGVAAHHQANLAIQLILNDPLEDIDEADS